MTKKTSPTATAVDPVETADPFHGQGGSYIVNPATGERELVSRTDMAAAEENEVKNADAI